MTVPIEDLSLVSITQTIVNATSTTAKLVAANPKRKLLKWMVTSGGPVTISPGTGAAVFGTGFIYSGAGANVQGGAETLAQPVSGDAFQVICNSGQTATVAVWEGN